MSQVLKNERGEDLRLMFKRGYVWVLRQIMGTEMCVDGLKCQSYPGLPLGE